MKSFVQNDLFEREIVLDDANTLRNLSELVATKTLIEVFKKAVNALTVQDKGDARISDSIRLRQTRPFVAKDQGYVVSKKSVFNKTIGDSGFELEFAAFLENCSDVKAYGKNYLAVRFKLDYVTATGDISNYIPDFFIKLMDGSVVIVETKGQEDVDVPLKMARLKSWCDDVNAIEGAGKFRFVYVDQVSFEKYTPKSFADLLSGFAKFRD